MSSFRDCLGKIPYATFIATVLCLVGIGVFCGTFYRAATLTSLLLDNVFHIQVKWVTLLQMLALIFGGILALLAFIILIVGCLATGSTRHTVYRAWKARAGGRLSCAIFLGLCYILYYVWTAILALLVCVTIVFSFFWGLCANKQQRPDRPCIDFVQFDWLFPNGTRVEDMQVCGPDEIKLFCKDYVENAEVMYILSTVAAFLVSLSLVHYLMCLASNYAYIRDQEKISDLQEMQYLQDSDMSTLGKDRLGRF
nr:EOG090X085S [Triops cancriformis]